MTPADTARLERLRVRAVERLREEGLTTSTSRIAADLDVLLLDAAQRPTESALAVFASATLTCAVTLPVEVEERTVVDPTFATRDLVRALHRTPRHAVLVLSAHRAALFTGHGSRLAPAGGRFPLDLRDVAGPGLDSAMRLVDRSLGAHLRLHPSPLVLAGPERTVAAFLRISRNTSRLAGVLHGSVEHADLADLAARSRPLLERYLLSREEEALALLDRRAGVHRVASGISSAWLAGRTERPEMLAVEEGYRFPARLSADGDLATPADDVEAPDVIDDLVDELIETVLARGGWVALVRDGTLDAHDRVALTLRS